MTEGGPGTATWLQGVNWWMDLLRSSFAGLLSRGRPIYRWTRVVEGPDQLVEHTVYIVGLGIHRWSAEFLCPCGCGTILRLSLHREGRPRWSVVAHRDGRVSLSPSVWRVVGCRSHFILRRGLVHFV